MNALEAVRVALAGLVANKLRSFLTMLGVIIGVAAVIIVVGIGQGLQQDTLQRIERMGTNILMVRPGAIRHRGVSSDQTVINLEVEDADEIRAEVKGVLEVAPEITGSVQAKYRSNNKSSRLVGSNPQYETVRNLTLSQGRFFDRSEMRGRKRVAVIGSEVWEELFWSRPAVGEWIRVNGTPFEVVGVLEEVGGSWGSPDGQIIAPLTTVKARILGRPYLNMIGVSAASPDLVDQVEKGIERLLRRRHKLRTGQPNDFSVIKQAAFLSTMTEAGETMTRLLGSIALVSLLVGGVGIMNIMLVSVTERTREIGIRKAVGARKTDILSQFLIESVVLSVIGGAIGVGIGVGVCKLLSAKGDWTAIISPTAILQAFLFAAAVGIFFGLWPAKKAADMDPIVALRHE